MWKWFKRMFKREDVIVKEYLTTHIIGGKTYNVPDSSMKGKIIINAKGEPEIVYTTKEEIEDGRKH